LFNCLVRSDAYARVLEQQRTGRKECRRCLRDLSLTAFGPCSGRSDGLKSWCRECCAADTRWRKTRLSPRQRRDLLAELAAQRKARDAVVRYTDCCGAGWPDWMPAPIHEPNCFAAAVRVRTPQQMAAARNGLG
jgi:hypothetical protein